jgi:hypothetical protein
VPRSLPLPIAWLSLACVSACRDQLSKLAAHVEIASKLNTAIDAGALTELGKLEQVGDGWGQAARPRTRRMLPVLCQQRWPTMRYFMPVEHFVLSRHTQDLVYGDATSREVIAFLTAHQGIPAADKVWCPGARAGSVSRWAAGQPACPRLAAPIKSALQPPSALIHACAPGHALTPPPTHASAGAPAHVLLSHSPGEAGRHPRGAVAEGGAPGPRGHGHDHQPGVPGGAGWVGVAIQEAGGGKGRRTPRPAGLDCQE